MIRKLLHAFLFLWLSIAAAGQQPNAASVIRLIDGAVSLRSQRVLAFTDIERYAVYRGKDEIHPVAQMTVRDSYRRGIGKTYTVLSQTGSPLVQKLGLQPLLDHETRISQPADVNASSFTSANYDMTLKPGGIQHLNGRACYMLAIEPRQKASNMIDGTIWVDATDGTLVKVDGIASKNPSVFSGTTRMMREYRNIDGFSMAVYARAASSSLVFGRTVVVIQYGNYHLELAPHAGATQAANRK